MRTMICKKEDVFRGPVILVNQTHPLRPGSEPQLTAADDRCPGIRMERRAAGLLNACIRAVGGENAIVPVSGWRSREEQQAIWDDTLAKEGEEFTRQYVALPGCSEHQTGLAIDLGLAAGDIDFICPNFPYDGVCGAFRAKAADYGFILRYPAGKESVTGISHEPWHFRYVGVPHARLMIRLGLTLEEYVDLLRRDFVRRDLTFRAGRRDFRIRYYAGADRGPLPEEPGRYRQVSEDNCGGLVVTAWR